MAPWDGHGCDVERECDSKKEENAWTVRNKKGPCEHEFGNALAYR